MRIGNHIHVWQDFPHGHAGSELDQESLLILHLVSAWRRGRVWRRGRAEPRDFLLENITFTRDVPNITSSKSHDFGARPP